LPISEHACGSQYSRCRSGKLDDLSSANYIDNRSDPVTVIKSLLNAINSQQYVRAYSYFQETPSTYAVFAAQYANTASVDAQFGTFTPDAGAGQIYYTVPAVVKTTLNDGTLQTASVCYTLHLSQPGIQGDAALPTAGDQEHHIEASRCGG